MDTNQLTVTELFNAIEPLFGMTPESDVKHVLSWMGKLPFPGFAEDEYSLYLSRKDLGFCLLFQDAQTVKHPSAQGKAPRTPIFTGCFFYPGGVEEYETFTGALPGAITWTDTSASLVAKLGAPKNEIMNKLKGSLKAHRWHLGALLLTANYRNAGAALHHIYVGIV
jgi:hypothetical protein